MAKVIKETIKTIYCDRLNRDVALVEGRVYPADILPDTAGTAYHVQSRECNFGVDCNRYGYSCKWSGLNPDYDPFEIE